jgi:hypothetical protein
LPRRHAAAMFERLQSMFFAFADTEARLSELDAHLIGLFPDHAAMLSRCARDDQIKHIGDSDGAGDFQTSAGYRNIAHGAIEHSPAIEDDNTRSLQNALAHCSSSLFSRRGSLSISVHMP